MNALTAIGAIRTSIRSRGGHYASRHPQDHSRRQDDDGSLGNEKGRRFGRPSSSARAARLRDLGQAEPAGRRGMAHPRARWCRDDSGRRRAPGRRAGRHGSRRHLLAATGRLSRRRHLALLRGRGQEEVVVARARCARDTNARLRAHTMVKPGIKIVDAHFHLWDLDEEIIIRGCPTAGAALSSGLLDAAQELPGLRSGCTTSRRFATSSPASTSRPSTTIAITCAGPDGCSASPTARRRGASRRESWPNADFASEDVGRVLEEHCEIRQYAGGLRYSLHRRLGDAGSPTILSGIRSGCATFRCCANTGSRFDMEAVSEPGRTWRST